jgi:lipoyl(octanoyl) transferase
MNIEIKKSIKPIKYEDAIKLLEERLLEINDGQKDDLIWSRSNDLLFCYRFKKKKKRH